jgi:prophage maintenance system killer protein
MPLEGAVGRPATHAHDEQADLALQASVLAHGIAQAQPFVDGNKRTALAAMLTFLEINGYSAEATDREARGLDHRLQPRSDAGADRGLDPAAVGGCRPRGPTLSRNVSRTQQF